MPGAGSCGETKTFGTSFPVMHSRCSSKPMRSCSQKTSVTAKSPQVSALPSRSGSPMVGP